MARKNSNLFFIGIAVVVILVTFLMLNKNLQKKQQDGFSSGDSGMPWWAWILIAVGGFGLFLAVQLMITRNTAVNGY